MRWLLVVLGLLAVPGMLWAAEPGPTELAGLRLGDDIATYSQLIDAETAAKGFFRPHLEMVALKDREGLRSAYADYGTCKNKGRIVRIKVNYRDGSLKFFEKLLTELKKRYGQPEDWRGNPFGTLRAWKWSLPAGKDRISMVLMYYAGDDGEYTEGNSLRITSRNMVEEEDRCYKEKKADEEPATELRKPADVSELDWLLPK
ncbi:hypothetical protein [Desulfolutivibrio sulfoxidireducens]|uniref:hypothetical protein n=1 Tax=Desulfolutivibrio sulfoxidireducens TaxID=2773299 RepID=UPI00159CFD8A|nr:hypothetical protein [Desulfolutivibrio sulfoxidireducens]QLA16356.1 hypothetical protein GD605_09615 [Desulfolutivibrio sulfoxidireducens]QLA19752.1 hypothetical protein GD604_08390 [Desulfolutivibrio sulfoxidireducens]